MYTRLMNTENLFEFQLKYTLILSFKVKIKLILPLLDLNMAQIVFMFRVWVYFELFRNVL